MRGWSSRGNGGRFSNFGFGKAGGSGLFTSSYVFNAGIEHEGKAAAVGAVTGIGNGFFAIVYSSIKFLHCSPNGS